jgi:arylsulfatase A-like enzyme
MRHLWLAGLLLLPSCDRTAQRPGPPNVVFMISDDFRWDLLGLEGHPFVRTPHLDALARDGAAFRNAFVTTSLCSPSRASFLTGRYAHQHGVRDNRCRGPEVERFTAQEQTWPALLKARGYDTAYFGKFHIVSKGCPQPGFDTWKVLPEQGQYVNPKLNVGGHMEGFTGHADDIAGDLASAWLGESGRKDRPFCLCVGFKAPHAPMTPPERLNAVFADAEIPEPASLHEDFQASGKPDVVSRSVLNVEHFSHGMKPKGGWQPFIKDFYRCVMGVDENVGKILAALKRTGMARDTLVVFVGDNGFFLGEHGLMDKRFAYEEALRIPMIARFPGRIPPGTRPEAMALNIDIAPTLLEYCGAPIPDSVAGRSLAGVLAGAPPADWRKDFFYEYAEAPPRYFQEMSEGNDSLQVPFLVAVRSTHHKYIDYLGKADRNELYDLAEDPGEMLNHIDNPALGTVLEDLKTRLKSHEERLGWTPP